MPRPNQQSAEKIPSEESVRLWREALGFLNEKKLLDFLRTLKELREVILSHLMSLGKPLQGEIFLNYYSVIHKEVGINECNIREYLSPRQYQLYCQVNFYVAKIHSEEIYRYDKLPIKEQSQYCKLFAVHKSMLNFMPQAKLEKISDIKPVEKETIHRYMRDELVVFVPNQQNILTPEFTESIIKSLLVLERRFMSKLAQRRSDSSRKMLETKKNLLQGLINRIIHDYTQNNGLRAGDLDRYLHDAINNPSLNMHRDWPQFFHHIIGRPHTTQALEEIRYLLSESQAKTFANRTNFDEDCSEPVRPMPRAKRRHSALSTKEAKGLLLRERGKGQSNFPL